MLLLLAALAAASRFDLEVAPVLFPESGRPTIGLRLVNRTGRPCVAFDVCDPWTVSSVGAATNAGFTGTATMSDQSFKRLAPGDALTSSIRLDFIFRADVKDGDYPCRIVYDDQMANGQARSFDISARSQVGRVVSPKLYLIIRNREIVGFSL